MTTESFPWIDLSGQVVLPHDESGRVLYMSAWELEQTLRLMGKRWGLTFERVSGPMGNPCFMVVPVKDDSPMLGGQQSELTGREPMLGGNNEGRDR